MGGVEGIDTEIEHLTTFIPYLSTRGMREGWLQAWQAKTSLPSPDSKFCRFPANQLQRVLA